MTLSGIAGDIKMNEVIEKLQNLLDVGVEERVFIQTMNTDITYEPNFDSNFEDRKAYLVGQSRFIEETTILNTFKNHTEMGHSVFSSMIYSWRSMAHSIPPISDSFDKNEYYTTINDVLEPEIKRIFDLYDFIVNIAKPSFMNEFKKFVAATQKKEPVSFGLIKSLCEMVDMFFILDTLKDSKVSIKNDFSIYKRYDQLITDKEKRSVLLSDIQRANMVSMFLAQNQQIMTLVKIDVQEVTDYQILLIEMVNTCCSLIENQSYFVPGDNFVFIRAIVACMILLDNTNLPIPKLEKKYDFSISRIDKILKEFHVVPILGDMQLNTSLPLKKLSTLSFSTFTFFDSYHMKLIDAKYNFPAYISRIQDTHFKIVSDLGRLKADLLKSDINNSLTKCNLALKCDWSSIDSSKIFILIQNAFKHLASLTENTLTFFAFKMINPAETPKNEGGASESTNAYEALTKYNYSNEEKTAMVYAITYIKSMYNILKDMETYVSSAVASSIHGDFHLFIDTVLKPLLAKAQKSSKYDVLKLSLSGLLSVFPVLSSNEAGSQILKGKSLTESAHKTFKKKAIGQTGNVSVCPLTTQMYMAMTTIDYIIHKSEYKKIVDSNMINQIHQFMDMGPTYLALLNYSKTLRHCSDLGIFWFREFYLEITAGQRIQFSIEDSVPWILASHIIDSSSPDIIESLIYVIDLYNDSAQRVLTFLKRKYMYDEIEAETNLVFEQLVHKLAEKVYGYYRVVAASMHVQKSIRYELSKNLKKHMDNETSTEISVSFAPYHRYDSLLTQCSVHILGREVDLSFLLSQRVILSIRKSLDYAFSYFEACSIAKVYEFDNLIEITELTHRLLSKKLNLPAFSVLYEEANSSVLSNMTKFTLHVLWDIVNDVIPNYAFSSVTGRLIPGAVTYTKDLNRPKLPSATHSHTYGSKSLGLCYSAYGTLHSFYIDGGHFKLIFKYLGYSGMAIIVEQLTKYTSVLIQEKFTKCISVLRQGMPPKTTLPKMQYGFEGCMKYFGVTFENIFKYKDLYPRVFQTMREIGNCVILCHCLELCVKETENYRMLFASLYQGVTIPNLDSNIKVNFTECDSVEVFKSSLDPQNAQLFDKARVFVSESLTYGLSFFNFFLYNTKSTLNDETWTRKIPRNGVISNEDCTDFHRLFSVLCIAMVTTAPPNNLTIEQIYGDALIWFGETMTALLGESHLSDVLDFVQHACHISLCEDISSNTNSNGLPATRDFPKPNQSDASRFKLLPKMKVILSQRKHVNNVLSSFLNSFYYSSVENIRTFSAPKYVPE